MSAPKPPAQVPIGHQLIRASAGSGKTYTLSVRYLRLLAQGVEVDRILASTFTRKAAGEIFQRVVIRLAKAVLHDDHRKQLQADLCQQRLTAARCSQLLCQLLRNLHRVRVGTLDSYFNQIARTFSLELGLPAGWQIADSQQEERLRSQAIQNVLTATDRQAAVILMHRLFKGDCTQQISSEILNTVKEMHEIWMDAAPDAWNRLRYRKCLESDELQTAIERLQSFSGPPKGIANGISADIQRCREQDWQAFLKTGVAAKVAKGEAKYKSSLIAPELAALYQPLIEHARSIELRKLAEQNEATGRLLAEFDAEYQRCKERAGLQSFKDICCRLAEAQWHSDLVDFRMDTPVEHMLLDEFQDTSHGQWTVLRPLARRICDSPQGSLFCVGDTKQAIYSWRGGDARIFDSLHQDLVGVTETPLDVSRRSSPVIIDFVNHLFRQLRSCDTLVDGRPEVARWLKQFPVHTTAETNLDGYVALECSPEPDSDSDQSFLSFAAHRIRQLHGDYPTCSIGVLMRSNKKLAELMYHLQREHVEASQEGGNPIADSAAVHLIVALLRLIDHPQDRISLYHLAHSPWGEQLGLKWGGDAEQVVQVVQQLRRKLADCGYGDTLSEWVEQLAPEGSAHDRLRLHQVQALAFEFESMATLRTRDFIDYIQQSRVEDARDAPVRLMTIHGAKGLQFDIVVLPEVDAKVYQVPRFVYQRPGDDGRIGCMSRYANETLQTILPEPFKTVQRDHEQRLVEDALCLLYVAVTRPVHALHMLLPCSCQGRKDHVSNWLLSALADGQKPQAEALLYSHGSAAWRPAAERTSARAALSPDPPAVRLAAADGPVALVTESPSQREGGSVVPLARLVDPHGEARQRGTLLHAWLETLQWLDDGRPNPAELNRRAAHLGLLQDEVQSLLKDLDAFLATDLARSLLERHRYQQPQNLGFSPSLARQVCQTGVTMEVRNEVPIAALQQCADQPPALVSGFVDRLVLFWKGDQLLAAEVVDYKTDQLRPNDTASRETRVDYYRPQLELYKEAVQQMLQLPPASITARLVFVQAQCQVFV